VGSPAEDCNEQPARRELKTTTATVFLLAATIASMNLAATTSRPATTGASAGSASPVRHHASPKAPVVVAMPKEFAPLLSRSIFVKGRSARHSAPAPSTQPTTPAAAAEAVLVLNGVTKTTHELTAFIEDRSTGKVTPLRLNEPIARGKVVGITLDALSYEANGHVVRVAIGDNLRGEAAPKPSSRPTSGASDAAGATTAPSPQIQSVLERLRLKRQQELQHK
jgi:hypothetical protein